MSKQCTLQLAARERQMAWKETRDWSRIHGDAPRIRRHVYMMLTLFITEGQVSNYNHWRVPPTLRTSMGYISVQEVTSGGVRRLESLLP